MIDKHGKHLDARQLLKELYTEDETLEFVCYFKSMPFVHAAKISKLTRHYILFNTTPNQIVAIQETGHVYIISKKYPNYTFEAKFLEMSKTDDTAISLYDFEVFNQTYRPRQKLRIVPDSSFELTLIDFMIKIHKPDVNTISSNSISLSFDRLPSTINMNTEFHIKIKFRLDNGESSGKIAIKCSPIRIGEVGGLPKVVASFISIKKDNQELLDKYLYDQQLKVIQEFKSISDIVLWKVNR